MEKVNIVKSNSDTNRRGGVLQRAFGLAALSLVLLVPFLTAQGPTTGSINGIVTDVTGAVVADAVVTATSPSLVVPQSTLTSGQGSYRFPSLPPGTYSVTVKAVGFAIASRTGIVINAGFSGTVDVVIAVAGQTQTVAVLAEAPLLDTENTRVQDTFSSQQLKDIPTARDMWILIGIAPDFSFNRFDVGGSTAGTQTGYTSYGYGGRQATQ